MKEIIVSYFTRPSLSIEEVKQDDGSFKPGQAAWTAIEFDVPGFAFKDVIGQYDKVRLINQENTSEIWEFHNVNIMLSFNKMRAHEECYILTYDQVSRVVRER